MRFYQLETHKKIDITDGVTSGGNVITYWFGTERDAIVARNQLFQAGGLVGLKRQQLILIVDVPTDKAGLLKFLQKNVTTSVVIS